MPLIYKSLGTDFDEWHRTLTLTLHDDGRFVIDELATCYAGAAVDQARGRWHRVDRTITLEVESSALYWLKPGTTETVEEAADGWLNLASWELFPERELSRRT